MVSNQNPKSSRHSQDKIYDKGDDRGLRLLSEIGRDLAAVHIVDLDQALNNSAQRAAEFAGYGSGWITYEILDRGYPLIAPGIDIKPSGTLVLEDKLDKADIFSERDEQILAILTQLIAATIVRVKQEVEKDDLHLALKKRELRLKHVVDRLFSVQETERRKVSAELHDSVAQTASALYRRLEVLASKVDSKSTEEMELANIAKGLVSELRQIIAGLRPTILDDLGLAAALNTFADNLRVDGYDVNFSADYEHVWPHHIATAFYRIGQEALNNIVKHSGGPCLVDIDLRSQPRSGLWELAVRDYGTGIKLSNVKASDQPGQHIGLEVMQERMLAIGGNLTVKDFSPAGFQVLARVQNKRDEYA